MSKVVEIAVIVGLIDMHVIYFSDKLTIGYSFEKQSKLKDDENCKFQIVLSPIIKYATNVKFALEYQLVYFY